VFHSKPEGRTSTIGKNFLSFDEEGMTTHHCCRTAYFTCIYSGKAHEKCACGVAPLKLVWKKINISSFKSSLLLIIISSCSRHYLFLFSSYNSGSSRGAQKIPENHTQRTAFLKRISCTPSNCLQSGSHRYISVFRTSFLRSTLSR
jgi:hypothetical protein